MVTVGAGPAHNYITKNQTRISKTPDNTGNNGRYRHKNNSHFDVFLSCRVPQLMSVLLTEFMSAFKIFSVFVEIDFVVVD